MQRKLKVNRDFYLMDKDPDSKVIFKFLDAQLLVNRFKPNPAYLLTHTTILQTWGLVKYYLTRVELKTFTFSSGSQLLLIENAVLGSMPKRLLFTMIKNKDFLSSLDTNPFRFQHYDLNYSL